MSKKQLKQRIKELEFENEMLRAMRPYPVYYRVYGGSTAHVSIADAEDNTDWQMPKIGSGSIGCDPDAKYKVRY